MQQRLNNLTLRRERTFRNRVNPLETYVTNELYDRFRFTRQGIMFIASLIHGSLRNQTQRSFAVPPIIKLLLTLQFLATGSFQIVIGDDCGISQPTVCCIVWKVIRAISALAPQLIKYPRDRQSRADIARQFYQIAGMPNVISLIDCTHIRIQRPWSNEDVFVNRKNYHSVNIQATMDCNFKYTSVTAKYPGSMHDSAILQESALYEFHQSSPNEGYLLGDSGYPCKHWLLTPYLNPAIGSPKERFNRYV